MPHPQLAALAALAFVPFLAAQGLDPVGRIHPNARPLAQVDVLRVPALDRTAISHEDVLRRANGQPPRFAIPHAVSVNPLTHGSWDVLDATWSLWRLRIEAPEASHVNLGFQTFFMPAGARLMVYSSNYQDIVRPFDATDHSPTGQLWTPVVQTAEITAEVYVPTAHKPQLQLQLVQVGSGYRFFGAGPDAVNHIDGSGSCNIDVLCPSGTAWALEIPSVAALSSMGQIFCSGNLINNTANDGRPLFLTAYHCGVTMGSAPSLVCYWNYRETNCGGGGASLGQFTTGATWRAGYSTTDFTLVELNAIPNPAWNISWAGWNRGSGNAASAVGIHHPSGDSKKISFENQAPTVTSYLGTAVPGDSTHIRVIDWDAGVTEPGSSGSPLFDENHRVIGQLHGGGSACGNNLSDWYGRLFVSWTGGGTSTTRLSDWLDPISTGVTTLDTRAPVNGATVATATEYGTGCYSRFGSFAETFAANTFDLGGTAPVATSILFTPVAGGYLVQPGGLVAWIAPSNAPLAMGNDTVSSPLGLPFVFNHPSGTVTQVRMCSNGYVWLNSTTTTADATPTAAELAQGGARFAPLWMDLDPSLGGTCHFEIDPSNTEATFTWNNVPHAGGTPGAGNSCQLVLRIDGSVEYRYLVVGGQSGPCVTGWSRGASNTPPNVDLSTTAPFEVTSDAAGLTFSPINRPLLGLTQALTLSNVPNPQASIGLVLMGLAAVTPPLDLAVIGAPGCFLHSSGSVILTLLPLSAVTSWNLPIPATQALAGQHVYLQGGALIPPGTNAFNALTSNGVDLLLGAL